MKPNPLGALSSERISDKEEDEEPDGGNRDVIVA
jgi:hypothetical protein